nr:hypothetical protein GCM10020185_64580 [Pseudomonas brassicacearum subsp. brassicacearum]
MIEDIASAAPPVTEGPPQRRDVHPQVDGLHDAVWPDVGDECLLADVVAGVFHQHLQDVQGTAAQRKGLAVTGDQPLLPVEGERTEAHRRLAIGFDVTVHGRSSAG